MSISPISSVYLINVERIPLSLCCVSGLALFVSFVYCEFDCEYCPWEANLNVRSSKIVNVDLEQLSEAIDRYRPDLLFIGGGRPWKYSISRGILSAKSGYDILRGVKIFSHLRDSNEYDLMLSFARVCDVILLELNRYSIPDLFIDIAENFYRYNHVEAVVVWSTTIADILKNVVAKLTTRGLYIPINIVTESSDENSVNRFIDSVRPLYPFIHSTSSSISEFSSVLCPKCLTPIISRSGWKVLKISLDDECKCKYCGHRVINAKKNVCVSRRIVRLPINIPIV